MRVRLIDEICELHPGVFHRSHSYSVSCTGLPLDTASASLNARTELCNIPAPEALEAPEPVGFPPAGQLSTRPSQQTKSFSGPSTPFRRR